MGITHILFWFLSVLAIFGAILVVISKNPVHSVLWLIVVFLAISGHYILIERPVSGDRKSHRLCRCHHGIVPVCDHADEPECGDRAAEESLAEDGRGRNGWIAVAGIGGGFERGGSEDADRRNE